MDFENTRMVVECNNESTRISVQFTMSSEWVPNPG